MSHPPFHIEKEGGAKVSEPKSIKVLQTQICQNKPTYLFK
jgi:hypothetical protein